MNINYSADTAISPRLLYFQTSFIDGFPSSSLFVVVSLSISLPDFRGKFWVFLVFSCSIKFGIWVFSEMSFPRFDRLALSDGGPLLIQYISDACVSSRQNDKQFFLHLKTNQRRLRGALLSWRYIST